jgi:acetoin utilization deacetylase AcuC-like enzyme
MESAALTSTGRLRLIRILHDPQTLLHHSVELLAHRLIPAYESPDRVTIILDALRDANFADRIDSLSLSENESEWPDIPESVHSAAYTTHLRTIYKQFEDAGFVDVHDDEESSCVLPECFPHTRLLHTPGGLPDGGIIAAPQDPFARMGYYAFDMSCGMSKDTFRSAIAAVNVALKGADMLLTSLAPSHSLIFCVVRPPGHHACHSLAGGYCYINTAAVVTEYILSQLPSPPDHPELRPQVAILDLDVHHGNGTQTIFYNRRSPAYISIHGAGEYPYYTGSSAERGSGEGSGFNRNLPLPLRPHSTREDYFTKLDEALRVVKDEWKAELVVLSLGFDTYRLDVLGGFELDIEDYAEMGRRIARLGIPVLALLEGGYGGTVGKLAVEFLSGYEAG